VHRILEEKKRALNSKIIDNSFHMAFALLKGLPRLDDIAPIKNCRQKVKALYSQHNVC
jgi:hypothetical protein